MKRFAIALLSGIAGYILVAFVGYWLIDWFSSNMHDRSVEAAMTSVFVFGPIGAVVGIVVGYIVSRRASDGQNAKD